MRRSYFQRSASGRAGERPRGRRALQRAVRAGSWVLLAVLLLAAAAFYAAIGVEHANPPVIAVQGSSMRPALSNGDLAVLQGVSPTALHKGDVIAVAVPPALQARDHLPPDIEHRIVGVVHTAHGIRFRTKGDANPKPDPFEVRPSEIVGKVTGSIPLLGYVFLFFGSVPGDVLLAFLAAAAAAFFLVRWWSRRRACLRRLAGTIVALREDADEIRTALTTGGGFPAPAAEAAGPEQEVASGELGRAASALQELVSEVRSTSDQSRDSAAMLRELVGAVSEYGVHLRSHTAVMRNLAATTEQLQGAATRLADAVTRAPSKLSRVPPEDERGMRGPAIHGEVWREPFTATELRWPNLPRTADGYVAEPVDRLLDRAADALELAERERDSLRDRLLVVETRLAILNEQRESTGQSRLQAERRAQEVDARARHDATLALEEASRRAADIVRNIEEERQKLLGIVRELGGQLLTAGEPSASSAPPTAPPVAREPSTVPMPSGTAATRSPQFPTQSPGGVAQRRKPPDVPPVWEVTPPPTR